VHYLVNGRAPLVISAIINVAQDVDKDWVLEVIGHDGRAVNLTMEPGSMILYESHSILHGRPFPLQGRFYANCFLHFEPLGYSAAFRQATSTARTARDKFEAALRADQHHGAESAPLSSSSSSSLLDSGLQHPRQRSTRDLPDYIREGTIEASRWRQEFVFDRVEIPEWSAQTKKSARNAMNNAHVAAAIDDVHRLREIAAANPKALNTPDINGWKPIHEAARGGNVKAIVYLLTEYEGTIDVNERTNKGQGGTPLWWAEQVLPEGHMALDVLRQHGAVAIAPERRLLNE
jgi:prolyl 4-hydroxylase